jgi:phage-related protein
MSIIIQNDGIIMPFNIQSSRETRFTILPQTRDITEKNEVADGETDFGTWLEMGEFYLHGVIEFGSLDERNILENNIRHLLYECRNPQKIFYECSPDKCNYITLTGAPEIKKYPKFLEIRAQFKAYPFWQSTEEHSITGNGELANIGTVETGLVVEISGPATNPIVTIGADALKYTGVIPAGQKLIIDTEKQTAKIGLTNTMAGYNGVFPLLFPGSANVTAGSNVTIKWKDRWV